MCDGSITLGPGANGHGIVIDGTKTHEVSASDGERLSVVAYLHSTTPCLSDANRALLMEAGFWLPSAEEWAGLTGGPAKEAPGTKDLPQPGM